MPATNKAAVTVKAARSIEVISIVTKVRNISTNNTFANTLYSVICGLLFDIIISLKL